MKKIKSHLWYTKNQRNGILFLITSIVGIQLLFHFINFEKSVLIALDQTKIKTYQTQLDSLRKISSADKCLSLLASKILRTLSLGSVALRPVFFRRWRRLTAFRNIVKI